MNQQNLHHQLLKILQAHPHISQCELAEEMGASLGKANYCMRALMEKGLVKLENFQQAESKRKYAYLLTPAGIEEKTRITLAFLRRKEAEYEIIKQEIAALRSELDTDCPLALSGSADLRVGMPTGTSALLATPPTDNVQSVLSLATGITA